MCVHVCVCVCMCAPVRVYGSSGMAAGSKADSCFLQVTSSNEWRVKPGVQNAVINSQAITQTLHLPKKALTQHIDVKP